jgi:hypothetical protein
MKKYTRRRVCGRYGKRKTRSRRGGASKRPKTPAPTPAPRQSSRRSAPKPNPSKVSRASSRVSSRSATDKSKESVLVFKNGVSVSQSHGSISASSRAPLRSAGILKKQILKDDKHDAEALEAAKLIANFPQDMDKFLKMVIDNYELLNYEGVKYALLQKISINTPPAVGRLSKNGIIFISYICGKINHLLKELLTTAESDVGKKISLRYRIKQIEKFVCSLDGIGCSWGIRPYNKDEMETINKYYRVVKNDEAGLQEYYQELNELIDTYFPVLKKHTDPSHVVSSSMCRRLIPGHVMCHLPTIDETEEVD